MKIKIIQNIKAIILGLIVTLGMGYVAAATFVGPGCAPPGCNADVPINASSSAQIKTGPLTVGGLGIVGNFTFLPSAGAIVPAGSILTSGSGGVASWQTPAQGTDLLAKLVGKALVAYGEGYANPIGDSTVELIENPILTPGTKYAFLLLTSGDMSTTRKLNWPAARPANLNSATDGQTFGQDSGRQITIRCGNSGTFSTDQYFFDLKGALSGNNMISYQGTIVYNPQSVTSKNGGSVHVSWGLVPYEFLTAGQTYKSQDITFLQNGTWGGSGASSICTSGRGYYTLYVYDYNVLKNIMDGLYDLTGSTKYQFNDPLSADSSLWNGDVWGSL